MTIPLFTWRRALGLLAVGPVLWLTWIAYRTCQCVTPSDPYKVRISARPHNCAVVNLPEQWALPDRIPGDWFDLPEFYELRKSKRRAAELLIGLRNMKPLPPVAGQTWRAKNKFAFVLKPQDRETPLTVDSVRAIREDEWAEADVLPYLDSVEIMDRHMRAEAEGDSFKGWQYPRDQEYSDFSTRRMASVNEIFIAVPSYQGPQTPRGFNLLPLDFWSRSLTIDVYRISSRSLLSRIRSETCVGGLGQVPRIVWHGDAFLTMPLDSPKREFIICDFRGK